MTSLGKGQTVTALTDPLFELQMNCRSCSSCSEWPYPTKINQHKYTGKALVAEWCNGKVCVCVLVSLSTSLFVVWSSGWWMLQKNRNLPRKSFDVLTHYHSSPRSLHPFKDLFSTDPCSIDWTTGLEPMENSSMSQSNTHCKCQGVLFSDWKTPLHLLTFLSSPSLVQDDRRIDHVV